MVAPRAHPCFRGSSQLPRSGRLLAGPLVLCVCPHRAAALNPSHGVRSRRTIRRTVISALVEQVIPKVSHRATVDFLRACPKGGAGAEAPHLGRPPPGRPPAFTSHGTRPLPAPAGTETPKEPQPRTGPGVPRVGGLLSGVLYTQRNTPVVSSGNAKACGGAALSLPYHRAVLLRVVRAKA